MARNALFPYFSELFLVFLLKHPSEQYMLSQWAKENFFCWVGLPGGPETAQIIPKLLLCRDSHQFVGTFSINYF